MEKIYQELVTFRTKDQIELDALFCRPLKRVLKEDEDIMFLFIHGLAMNFYCPLFINIISILVKNGYSALTANNRGHDLTSTRQGYFEKDQGALWELFPDSYIDILAAINYSHTLGYKNLVLVGHSLGGLKAVYSQSIIQDESIRGIVLFSPVRSMKSLYKFRLGTLFAEIVHKAEENVKKGNGDRFMALDSVNPYLLSSKTIVSYMGEDSIASISQHIGKIICPILLMLDDREKDFDPKYVDRKIDNLEIQRVVGADHFYYKKEPQVIEIIFQWLHNIKTLHSSRTIGD